MANRRNRINLRGNIPSSYGYASPRRGREWVRGVPGAGNLSFLRTQDSGMLWVGDDGSPQVDFSGYGIVGAGAGPGPYPTAGGGEFGAVSWTYPVRAADVLPAVTRATQLIVGPVARGLYRFYTDAGSTTDPSDIRQGRTEVPRPLWVADPQLYTRSIPGGTDGRPVLPRARRLAVHAFRRTLLTHALWFGAAAMIYTTDRDGQPLAGTLRILHPDRWGVTEDGRYVLAAGTDDELTSDDNGDFDVDGSKWSLQVMRGLAPNDGSTPEGALLRSGLLLATAERTNSYLSSIFNSGVPSGILKINAPANSVTRDQVTNLKQMWNDAHGGPNREVAVLSSSVEYQPLQMSVVDADAAAVNNVNLINIAHAFGISAPLLDAAISGSSITYQRLSDVRQEHYQYTLAEWGRVLEDFVSSLLPYNAAMSIDWNPFLMADRAAAVPLIDSGLERGYLSPREVRDMLGITPIDKDEGLS